MNTIYTFWHDKENIPDYIKLCIDSWKKYLPDFEIILLDYKNYENYIGKDFYDKTLFENFTIAQQTQAIRAAILEQHGGYWFDADIVVKSRDFLNYFNDDSELNIFTDRISCIKAKKGSKILKKWVKGIKKNIFIYKHFFNFMFEHYPYKASDMMNWDYLSGKILHKYFKIKNKKLLNQIDIEKNKIYPELSWAKENKKENSFLLPDLFNHFYIKNNYIDFINENKSSLIILHNSWMPREYRNLAKEEISKKNNTLSNLLCN